MVTVEPVYARHYNTNKRMADNSKKNESFIRWQTITINQLSYVINLILGFSVAGLGFGVSLLLNDKFNPVSWQKYTFSLSLILLIASVAFGVWCTINRLRDFRSTMKIARKRNKQECEAEVNELRVLTRKLGKKTWGIFWLQIGSFSAGILLMVLSVVFSVSNKLF